MFRRQPPACTPISLKQVYSSVFNNENSEHEFNNLVKKYFSVPFVFTFQSFMYSIFNCLTYLKKNNPEKKNVIVPRYSCMTFAHAIEEAGLEIRYCDQNSSDLSIDYDSLVSSYSKNTLALICVNHLGLSNEMHSISKFCKKNSIYLIEDLGYSIGTKYKSQKLGTFGDFSVFNFKEGKPLPMSGGMVITTDSGFQNYLGDQKPMSANILRMFCYSLIIRPNIFWFFTFISRRLKFNYERTLSSEITLSDSLNEYSYSFDRTTPNYKLSNFQFKLGSQIFKKLDRTIKCRRKNFLYLYKGLRNISSLTCLKSKTITSEIHYVRCPIMVPLHRDELLNFLQDNNVEAKEMYPEVSKKIDNFPGSKRIRDELLTLPCHPGLEEYELDKIINYVKLFFLNK